MLSFLAPAGNAIYPYLSEISTALIACLLVMAGGEINAFLRRVMALQPFILRTAVFIIVNAFGYGLLIIKLTPYLTTFLRQLERGMMFTLILSSFILIGLWAQRNRQM